MTASYFNSLSSMYKYHGFWHVGLKEVKKDSFLLVLKPYDFYDLDVISSRHRLGLCPG